MVSELEGAQSAAIEQLAKTIAAMSSDMDRIRESRDRWQKHANIVESERNDALRKLAQAEGSNDLLRGQNEQLQDALKKAKGAGPTRPAWERTVAENMAAQAILDSAEPELAAMAASEEKLQAEHPSAVGQYVRTPAGIQLVGYMTSKPPEHHPCPTCHGTGKMMGIPDAGPCGRCGGTRVVQEPRDTPPFEPEGDAPAVATGEKF